MESGNDQINCLDADKWYDQATKAIDQKIAPQHGRSANRAIGNTPERQWNECNYDEGIEDDRRKNGASRRGQVGTERDGLRRRVI